MQALARRDGFIQVSVAWEADPPDQDDRTFELASAYAAVLARSLESAGFEPHCLQVAIRPGSARPLALHVCGDVDGLAEGTFASLARLTLSSPRVRKALRPGTNRHYRPADLELVTELAPPVPRSGAGHVETTEETVGAWIPVTRIVVGTALGLLLGVVGLPRLDLPVPKFPVAQATLPPIAVPPREPPPAFVREPEPTPLSITLIPTVVPTEPRGQTGPRVVFAQRFVTPMPGWPHDPDGTSWFADSTYHLFARQPGRFVAVGVPIPDRVRDARVSAQLRQVAGPSGGGYGLIVRDQAVASERDGRNQSGRYLVFDVSDQGDFGVWQRDQSRWIEVVPWTHSEAVRRGIDPNTLAVTLNGASLKFEVNGEPVAQFSYTSIPDSGGVGVFVGGDLNEVALEWLRIEAE